MKWTHTGRPDGHNHSHLQAPALPESLDHPAIHGLVLAVGVGGSPPPSCGHPFYCDLRHLPRRRHVPMSLW